MHLLAGFTVGWATVHLIVALSTVAAVARYRQNRDYLAYAAFCTSIFFFDIARTGQYLGTEGLIGLVSDRILIACLVLAPATLVSLALRTEPDRYNTSRSFAPIAIGPALLLAVLSLAGLAHDLDSGNSTGFSLSPVAGPWSGYRINTLGMVVLLAAVGYSIAAGALVWNNARRNGRQWFFSPLSFALLIPLGAHDMLSAAGLIAPFFFGEQSGHLASSILLLGFLGRYQISRRTLRSSVSALHQAEAKAERAAHEVDAMRVMADLGKVSASLAHEIRNPLCVLGNVTVSLRRLRADEPGPEKHRALVSMVQEETLRLNRLVEDLLLFSHTGRDTKEPVDPGFLVRMAASDIEKLLPADTGIELRIEIEDDLGTVFGSPDGLRRALFNLIDNAVQSSAGKGLVRLTARRDSSSRDVLVIGVEDRAGGVPPDLVKAIFEPFYSTRSAGTGLGLTIADNIVKSHAGDLRLENRPGEGATFWMRFPLGASLASDSPDRQEDFSVLKTANAA